MFIKNAYSIISSAILKYDFAKSNFCEEIKIDDFKPFVGHDIIKK